MGRSKWVLLFVICGLASPGCSFSADAEADREAEGAATFLEARAQEEALAPVEAPAAEPTEAAPEAEETEAATSDEMPWAAAAGAGGGGRLAQERSPAAPAPSPAPSAATLQRARRTATNRARARPSGGLRGGSASPARAIAPAPTALPQNAVLASTFVGGSGAQARLDDLLDRGVMVDGRNVRLSAFDELGRLPYPVPAREAVGLHAEMERSRIHTGGERVHMQIALMARQGEAPARPRMDVRLVFDRSGSMMGEKWTQAVQAAHQLVDRLAPGDTFGLVSYSDDASLDLAPTRVGNRRSAHRAIDGLAPGGSTNIEAALRLAQRNAPVRRGMSDVLLVVLVSDGVANIGQTNPQELGGMARRLFDERGVLTTSVGLGTDFDEDTMLSIAREGSGSYHFVRRAADISEILTDELEERAQAVAQALRLRVELGEGVVATRVYGSQVLEESQARAVRHTEIATDRRLARELGIARDRRRDEDRGLRIHLPTFRRGDQHIVLMELEVPPGTDTTRIARITLDYKDLISRGNRSAHVEIDSERTAQLDDAVASTQRTVKRTVLAFQAGDALQAASEALGRGDLMGAHRVLSERQRVLLAGADLWNDRSLRQDADLLGRYDRVLSGAWNGWDNQSQRTMMLAMNFYGDRRMR